MHFAHFCPIRRGMVLIQEARPHFAINDNYDSLYTEGNELAPFKNLFNEWYARDTSKKIRAVVKAKAERGERVSTQIPYGYMKDPLQKNHLIIDPETAPIVKEIFTRCASGIGPKNIGNILRDRQVLKPRETRRGCRYCRWGNARSVRPLQS